MLLEEAGNFGSDCRIMTDVDRLRCPRLHRGWITLSGPVEHGDDELGA